MQYLISILTIFCALPLVAQEKATIRGTVTDRLFDEPVELVTIYVQGSQNVVESDIKGRYRILVEPNKEIILNFTRIGYQAVQHIFNGLSPGAVRELNLSLVPAGSDLEVIITDRQIEDAGILREDVEDLKLLPTTTGNLESALPAIALGTSGGTGGELSSQYNVRGGNYDENLVYVNDFEIFRPQLVRSGQQEGLSFPNIDLMRDLSFSSGGFESKYGDKMSSVLDIYYKRPQETKGSVELSLLGASTHIEGSIQSKLNSYKHFRYLMGARYKNNQLLLNSLDVKGEYRPQFFDFQTYLTYDLSRSLQLAVIANYNSSRYDFEPESRETAQGLIDFTLKLTTEFEGQEADDFATAMGGVSLTYIPDRTRNPLYLKFLTSGFRTRERERFDIEGAYRLSQIETGVGDDAGEEILVLGTGIQHVYARNALNSRIFNIEHKGGIEFQLEASDVHEKTHFLQWGVKLQSEDISDKLNEWERLDSAGYSLPLDPNTVQLQYVLKSRNDLNSLRYSVFIQDSYSVIKPGKSEMKITGGLRAIYWDMNKEFNVSPRFQILYKPLGGKDIAYRFATGLYYQPPFYREMRRFDGTVNRDLKAQKSFHILGGLTMDFGPDVQGRKKFRMIAEVYYKKLWDLVHYDISNVRIRYSGENDATGYVVGLDVRLNGEFVPGAESWINFSFQRAREKLDGIQHMKFEVGSPEAEAVKDVPRPTHQLVTVNVFFQDYLPNNENFKVHLNLAFGTGLPFGVPDNNIVFRNTFRYSVYRRVDIGFSVLLWDKSWLQRKPKHFLRFSRNSWLSLEVFNLLGIRNEADKTWIKAINNQQFAISNFLTSRRLNVRWRIEFG